MTNTQIAAQPYCFSSASSLASSTVSTWEDWKLRCFHSFAPFMKLLPKQPHRKKKRAMCCRGVLICTQTYEPVQLYRAEGGGMSISFLFLSLLSSTHTVHASLFLHTGVFFFICDTHIQYMHAITQRHNWTVFGFARTNFTLIHEENNWLSCYLETYYVPFSGEANTLTLAIICFSTHIQMCACIYTYKYICTDIKGSWSFPLQQDYSINHWAEWPNTIPLYVMWERILGFLQIKNRFLVSLSCSEKIKSKFACGSTNCWVGTVLTLWKYFWNVHRWKSSDSWGK